MSSRPEQKPRDAGFLSDGNLSLRLSYHVFNAFNFDLYATIRSRAIDQGSARFHVVTGVAGNRVRFAHTTCGDFVRRNTFGDQVINNRLSTFLGQTTVVSVRTDTVSEAKRQRNRLSDRVAQLAVQLIQSLLAFRLQGRFVEVEQYVRLQSEVLGLYFRSRSWCRSYYRSSFLLAETVGNTYAQQAVVRTGADGVGITDVVSPLVFQTGCDFRGDSILDTAREYRETPVSWSLVDGPPWTLGLGVCTPYHTTQTGINVQIVSDWITQFSGQLNALSFISAIDVVAFVRHTA